MQRRIWFTLTVVLIALGFAWHVSGSPMDFRVYYAEARSVFGAAQPVYGELSGLGWPMHYRYPPPFLFVALPFTVLSQPWAAAIWVILKCGVLGLLIYALWNRLGRATSKTAWLVPLLLAGPYVVEDLRYGNAQSFIFALTGAALLWLSAAPVLAAGALALGISIKVWPLFFVPYLAARREWKVVGWTLVFTAVLLILPAMYFGFHGNAQLLSQWVQQEFSTQTGQSEIWFPSQSLRGVMMRYLTVIDYSRVPDSNYPLVQVISLDPNAVRVLWMIVAAIAYAALILVTARSRKAPFGLTEALAFTALVLLEPFSQKYALVVLLWPAMVAGRLIRNSPARALLYGAVVVTLVQPAINGATAQRLMQVLGFDFLTTALLAAFLLVSMFGSSTE